MELSGPDGKPIQSAAPMDRQHMFNMVFMIYTLMNRADRRMLRKSLGKLTEKLDLMYPMGMSKDDIARDVSKIQQETEIPDASIPSVPNSEGYTVSADPQGVPIESVHHEQNASAESAESGPVGA